MKEKIRNSSIVRRLLSIIAAVVMTLGMVGGSVVPAMAEDPSGSITITPAEGAADGQVYNVYKVFQGTGNGTNISYKLLDGKTKNDSNWTSSQMDTYFSVDDAGNVTALPAATGENGNLTQGAVNAIAAYVTAEGLSPVATVSTKTDGNYVADGLSDGYYYITTTTGTVVTIDSVNGQTNVEVKDKNTEPRIDKYITKVEDDAGSITADRKSAIAQVGKKVTFNAIVTIGEGAKGYVFRDTFPKGNTLTLDSQSINVYRVPAGTQVAASTLVEANLVSNTNYTLSTTPSTTDTWTFQISFKDDYTKTLNPADSLVVVYDATVTSNALSVDKATNSATISWGDPQHQTTSRPSTTDTYNAKITVNKTFQGLDSDASLKEGQKAEFVLKNADGKYYKSDDTTKAVSWVDTENDATKIEFTKAGSNTFMGLPNGEFTLIEVTVPDGYNKAADTKFTINAATIDLALTQANLEKTASIENKTGSTLPSTGGIGTTIFYVIGGVVVAGAVILLLARRRKNA